MATYIAYPTDEQEKFMRAFLEALEIPFVTEEGQPGLPQHVLDGIAQGEADIAASRFITMDEFKKRLKINSADPSDF